MHQPVSDAIKSQVDKFIHYTPAYMYHEPLVKLAKKLCEIAPGNYENVFFSDFLVQMQMTVS